MVDNQINQLQLKQVLKEIGSEGRKELNDLSSYLDYPAFDQVRYAPSIITRSESLLLGLSPRFAYRFNFSSKSGFVNFRRLDMLVQFAETTGHRVWSGDSSWPAAEIPPLRDILKGGPEKPQSCVADCFLPPPVYLGGRQFEILTACLNVAYGECLRGEADELVLGTPYVRHIDLGGGLCAESACFVSTALLHHHSRGVYGLAEITAFAHKETSVNLCISGLSLDDTMRYFDAVGLRATQQIPAPWWVGSPHFEQMRYLMFAAAIQAYLHSNMPVILPVEMARLAGYIRDDDGKFLFDEKQNVYASGVYPYSPDEQAFSRNALHSHQLILVGCSRSLELNHLEVVFHDPAVMPFMKTSARLLSTVGRYKNAQNQDREDMLFMPVTAGAVKLPLLGWRPGDRDPFNKGLYDIADLTHKQSTGRSYPRVYGDRAGHFLLVQVGKLAQAKFDLYLTRERRQNLRAELIDFAPKLAGKKAWDLNHWVWLEIFHDGSLWIWDAEKEIPPHEAGSHQERLAATSYLSAILTVAPGDTFETEIW